MDYSLQYENDSRNQIIIRRFKGYVKKSSIMESWEEMISKKMISPNHIGVISVYLDAHLKIELEDLKSFINYFKRNKELFKGFKIAQVLNRQGVVFPIDFEDEEYNFKSRSFLTTEEAINWIYS